MARSGTLKASGRIREHIRHNVVGYIALFCFAMGGIAQALPGKNSVDTGDIGKGQVKKGDLANASVINSKLAPDSVDGTKVIDNSLKGADVDEGSLNIPQQALPTSLPPSGPAGGDLSGSYPDPQVQESGLVTGGDLSGTVANAQVAESGLTAGGDLGGPLSNAQIGADAIGADELDDVVRSVFIGVDHIGGAALTGSGRPQPGRIGDTPALFFDPGTDEAVDISLMVPNDRIPNDTLSVRLYLSHPSATEPDDVSWGINFLARDVGDPVGAAPTPGFTASLGSPVGANELFTPLFANVVPAEPAIENGDLLVLRVFRDADIPADDLAGDAALHAIEIEYLANG